MEKILLAIDSDNMNLQTLDFACHIAYLTRSRLTGVFLLHEQEHTIPVNRTIFGMPYAETVVATDLPDHTRRVKRCEENIALFEECCWKRGIQYNVHVDKGIATEELVRETRFADLLIADASLLSVPAKEILPGAIIKEVLSKSECPVVVAPSHFSGIDEIVFAYDGSACATFAIRQFNALFPELSEKKITVVQVNEAVDEPIAERESISELLKEHYSSIGYQLLQGKADDELISYLEGKKNAIVIMGAFGRSTISSFFKKSTAELLLQHNRLPLFIAHR